MPESGGPACCPGGPPLILPRTEGKVALRLSPFSTSSLRLCVLVFLLLAVFLHSTLMLPRTDARKW